MFLEIQFDAVEFFNNDLTIFTEKKIHGYVMFILHFSFLVLTGSRNLLIAENMQRNEKLKYSVFCIKKI